MSETVGYVGKLTLHKKYKDANELQANLQKFWQSIPREKRNKFYQDVEEIDDYELEDNGYVIIDRNCIYKIELVLAGGNEIPSNHYGTLRDA